MVLRRLIVPMWDSGGPSGLPEHIPTVLPSCRTRLLHQSPFGLLSAARSERYIIPDRLKEVGPVIDDGRLFAFLRQHGSPCATLAHRLYSALKSVESFESEYLRTDGASPSLRRTKSLLPPRIFQQAVAAGVIKRLPRRFVPVTAAPLKAVADRKLAGVGRLIYPGCAVNDICRSPDPCPLPLLPDLVSGVLEHRYGFTADLRSWFYAFALDHTVAARYFATFDSSGRPYAHIRGPMGFSHMPTLATCVAQAIIEHAISGMDAYGVAWIDDITIAARTEEDAILARQRFVSLAAELNVELRDLTPVGTRISAVGLEFDLADSRWRLQEAWCSKVLDDTSDVGVRMSTDRLLRHAGRVAWVAYALQIAYIPFAPILRSAGRIAQKLVNGLVEADALHDISLREFDALQKGLEVVASNPWRGHLRPTPVFTVVTDASLSGFGIMVERGKEVVEIALPSGGTEPSHTTDHITVREAVALRLGVCRAQHVGSVVRCITDNTTLFWLLSQAKAPRNDAMASELSRLFLWCYLNRVVLVPKWLGTHTMAEHGADEASRLHHRRERIVARDRLTVCIDQAEVDTAILTDGCKMPRRSGASDLPEELVRRLFR